MKFRCRNQILWEKAAESKLFSQRLREMGYFPRESTDFHFRRDLLSISVQLLKRILIHCAGIECARPLHRRFRCKLPEYRV